MAHANSPCIVLFDIDGTLLSGPPGQSGAGVFAMNAASIDVTGKASGFVGADFAGRTDFQIARMLIEAAGPTPASPQCMHALIDAYVHHLTLFVRQHPYRPIGNPRAAVSALRKTGALVGLGTGNVRRGAAVKLDSAGIGDLFSPLEGGFGDDGETRVELLRRGVHAMSANRSVPVVIVGDTPRDVEGAKGIGALCVGIPFGKNSADLLYAAGADFVIETIDETLTSVIRALLED